MPAERYFQPPSGSSATIVPRRHPARLARGRDEHRAARRPAEDPLAEDEVAERGDRVAVRDEVLRVEERRVEDLGDEAFVERPQALDLLPGEWLRGDDPDAGLRARA